MTTILDQIVETKTREVAILKNSFTYKHFEMMPGFKRESRSLKSAINQRSFGIIAEIKRKSPSAGILNSNLTYAELAVLYENNGATAISCLTDFSYFGGTTSDLEQASQAVKIPILRKDFIIDEFQILQTKAMGADVILLIAEILSQEQITQFTIMAQSLGLEVLLEFHEKEQLNKLGDLADFIGVNNRNLKLQETTIQTSLDYAGFLPENMLRISESGIKTVHDLHLIKAAAYHGALIGESLLRHKDLATFLPELIRA